MPCIKFNQSTKEIELRGPETFIESNFDRIQDLLVENLGEKKRMATREREFISEHIPVAKAKEIQLNVKQSERAELKPIQIITTSSVTLFSQGQKEKRPPLRKYIRKVGAPGHERTVVEVVEQKPTEISVESLREKFGLSDSKIEGIIREAEKLGKVKRVMNGSYAWSQD